MGAFIYFRQSALLFPAPNTYSRSTPASIGLPFEDLQIPVTATDRLHAWWIPAAPPARKVILMFHGNGYVLDDMVADEVDRLHEMGTDLLLVDYRGYGTSSPIVPNEGTVDEDADASLNYLLRLRKIPMGHVFILGRSLGTGPAAYLAEKTPGLGGLILESPFTSVEDAAARLWYFGIYPARLMLHTHFDNQSRIGSVHVPILIACGTADTLTPPSMAIEIFHQAHEPKQLYLVPGAGHDDLLISGGDALTQVVEKFVNERVEARADRSDSSRP